MSTKSMLVILIICLIIIWPVVIIWALNTVFNLGIAYTFKTWIAVFILMVVFNNSKKAAKRK